MRFTIFRWQFGLLRLSTLTSDRNAPPGELLNLQMQQILAFPLMNSWAFQLTSEVKFFAVSYSIVHAAPAKPCLLKPLLITPQPRLLLLSAANLCRKSFDAEHGSDREVQRVLMELLSQMDGFDQNTSVKVIMATNRSDTLDPALLRPGRLDRKIEFPLPDRRQKRLIFQVVTSKMNLSPEVDLEDYVSRPDKISGADISSICMEAGMHAVRRNRYVVLPKDFEKAYEKTVKKPDTVLSTYT
jgi:SpoVK/Ycf46/Vps4 family AAA+-type ATPase